MPEINLDIVGSFGDLFPNLNKLLNSFVEIKDKNTQAFSTLNSHVVASGKVIDETNQKIKSTFDNIGSEARQLGDQLAQGEALRRFATQGVESINLVSTEVRTLINQFSAMADATILAANQFAQGEGKKAAALRSQVSVLQTLQEKLKASTNPADAQRLGSQIGIVTRNVQTLALEIKKSGDEFKKIPPNIEDVDQKLVSIQTELRKATAEAIFMAREFGRFSPQAKEAATRAAELRKEFNDMRESIAAFNPENKLAIVGQLARGIAGAFSAAQGALALFGTKSEEIEKVVQRTLGAIAISQGISEVVEIIPRLRNLAVILGFTTAAKKADTVAQTQNNIAVTEGAVKTGAYATVQAVMNGQMSVGAAATLLLRGAMSALLGPLGIALVVIGAVAGAISLFSGEQEDLNDELDAGKTKADDFSESMKGLQSRLDNINKLNAANTALLSANNQKILAEMKERGATEQELADKAKELGQKELSQQKKDIDAKIQGFDREVRANERRINQLIEDNKKLEAGGKGKTVTIGGARTGAITTQVGEDTEEEAKKRAEQIKANKAELAEAQRKNSQLTTDMQVAASEQAQIQAKFDADSLNDQAEVNKKKLENFKQLKEDLLKVQKELSDGLKDLADKSNKAQIESLTGQARLDAEREVALKAIDDINLNLLKKGQAEEDAAAKLAGRKAQLFKLSAEQEDQLEILRLLVHSEFANKSVDLEINKQKELIEATESGLQKQLDLLELNLKQREIELRNEGQSEIAIQKIILAERLKGTADAKLKQIDLEAETSKGIINQINIAGVNEEQAERIRQEKRLQVDLDAQKKRLAVLQSEQVAFNVGFGIDNAELNKDINITIGLINKLVNEIKAKQGEIKNNSKDFSLATLFGIDPEHRQAFNQAAQQILDSASQLVQAALAASLQQTEREIALSQMKIDQYNTELSALDEKISREEDLNKRGYANNLDQFKKQKQQLKVQRDAELAHQKEIQKEKAKIAKEQATIELAMQSISIISAAATTLSQNSATGPYGWIIGLAAVAALIAGYLAFRAQIKSIDNSVEFGGGGTVGGKPHSEGGTKYYSSDPNAPVQELEHGEEVTKKKQAVRHRKLLKAINNEDYHSIDLNELMPFLKPQGILLQKDIAAPIMQTRNEVHQLEIHNHSSRLDRLEEKVDSFHETVKNHFEDSKNTEQHLPDGSRKITTSKQVKIVTSA